MKKSGLVVAVLAIVALGFLSWLILGRNTPSPESPDGQMMAYASPPDSVGVGFGAGDASASTGNGNKTSGVTVVNFAPPPVWATRDIHEMPLGTILDYAVEVVQYDDSLGRGTSLPKNARGQGPFLVITPAEGVWGMNRATMRDGHIVAKIQSDGDYLDMGIVSGLNFLWVGNDPNGNLEWVLVPGTAFAPLKDLSDSQARRIFRQQEEVSSTPAKIRDF